jgi:hypothetical protein
MDCVVPGGSVGDFRFDMVRKLLICIKKADVAQLVEQSIRNRQVIGSSPIVGSSKALGSGYFLLAPESRFLAVVRAQM